MSVEKRKLVSFEGLDGSGKSTQMNMLEARLRSLSADVLAVREPGGTYIGDRIRDILQHDQNVSGMFPETEILLYEASRAQLVREYIMPALKEGYWVLCDRFFDSTTAYQGAGRQIFLEAVHWLNRFAIGNCVPELTFLFELPLHLRQTRLSQRPAKTFDRIEYEPSEFFKAVTEGYRQLAEKEPQRFVIINTESGPNSVAEMVWKHIYEHFFS